MIKRLIKKILYPPIRILMKELVAIERRMIQSEHDLPYSPVFIIGIPRSGTTLLYQLITDCFDVAYLSNMTAKYYELPCILSYFLSYTRGCTPHRIYRSSYGEITGWRAPSQGWLFWARWFPSEQNYVGMGEIPDTSIREIRNSISIIEKIYNRPFVCKNLSLGARLLPLNEAFPEALFIRIYRSHIDCAQSILKGRKEYTGDITNWFSVKPSAYEKIKSKDPLTQVCEQIYYLENDISRDMSLIGEDRCLTVSYAELCQNPKGVMEKILKFYEQKTRKGILKKRYDPPPSFNYSSERTCSTAEYVKLKECLTKLYKSEAEAL